MKFHTAKNPNGLKTTRGSDLASNRNRIVGGGYGKVSSTSMAVSKPSKKFGLTK